MRRYSKSLFFSLLVHLVLFVVVIASYYEVYEYLHEKKHDCSCCSTTINLSAIETKRVEPVKKTVQKEKPKKVPTPKKPEKVEKVEKVEKKIKVPLKTKESIKEIEETSKKVLSEHNATEPALQKKEESLKETHCQTDVITTKEPQEKADEYLSSHIGEIVMLLKENLHYPRSARKRKIEGVIKVRFTLSKDAEVANIKVIESKYEILSNAAVKTIEELRGKMPKPDEDLTLTIPIHYDLK